MVLTLIDEFHPAGNVNISSNKCIVVEIFLSKTQFFFHSIILLFVSNYIYGSVRVRSV